METTVASWDELMAVRKEFDEAWIFRGQPSAWPLVTSIERACELFEVPPADVPLIEKHMIRDFRRRYSGRHRDLIFADTLYCLALMQHHGAPTRLLDFTYSFYVACHFALEPFGPEPTIWCINGRWCRERAIEIAGDELIRARERDRSEQTFRDLFMRNPAYRLVFPENPIPLHRRLIIQQGVFACPGDVAVPFTENLAMPGLGSQDATVKLRLDFGPAAWRNALAELTRMNIDRASLFPGLDGFAQSLKLRIPLYQRIEAAWEEDD